MTSRLMRVKVMAALVVAMFGYPFYAPQASPGVFFSADLDGHA
jgi:hypothetical protein